jgi:hypothetical protein
MRMVLLAAVLVWAGEVAAADDEAAIEELIGDQFAAFADGDAAEAFSYASPSIRQIFGTAENFARMVQGGYPMIWAAEEVRYLGLREEAGKLFERVEVRDPSGGLHYFDYEMVRIDGVWRINGVWQVKDQSVGA